MLRWCPARCSTFGGTSISEGKGKLFAPHIKRSSPSRFLIAPTESKSFPSDLMTFPSLCQRFPAPSRKGSNDPIERTRSAQRLHNPVPIQFSQEGNPGNPLSDWYSQRRDRTIIRMQQRKERKGPFFHEYIVIQLDNEELYRLDRRPDETIPHLIHCATNIRVPASDTIEQTPSFEDSIYCSKGSKLLSEIPFSSPVQLQAILHILRAIHSYPKTRTYTLYSYNCYFFAQAIALCIALDVCKYHRENLEIKSTRSDDCWKAVATDSDIPGTIGVYLAPIQVSAYFETNYDEFLEERAFALLAELHCIDVRALEAIVPFIHVITLPPFFKANPERLLEVQEFASRDTKRQEGVEVRTW
ncbi:hypothetical protein B0J17DRAFT_772266 [Rhizoctonia solani]|nr:hypothetical protein B0J17DRAFT_772266 [Rhizoctonia solani]